MKVYDQHNVPFELIAKYLADEVNGAEKETVMSWILENEEEFERIVQSWEHTEKALKSPSIDVDMAWQKVQTQITNSSNSSKSARPLWVHPWRIAAAILLLFILGWTILNFFSPDIFSQTQIAQTYADTTSVQLIDGSEIALNSETKLKYPKKFSDKTREVHLSGEAFFEIARDEEKPFVVHTEGIRIQVLGTSFNVDAKDSSDSIFVTVKTGLVEVSVQNNRQEFQVDTIRAGEQIAYSRLTQRLSGPSHSNVDFLEWKTGELDFDHKTMNEVAVELAKRYKVKIVVDPNIQNCPVATSLDPKLYDIKQALEVFQKLLKYQIEIGQEVYHLSAEGKTCL